MFTKEKLWSIAKGAGIAAAGAALAYLGKYVGGLDLGDLGPAVAAVLAVLVNVVRKAAE